jgi:DNA-directed RNA polymerase subunit RPC12/RpoP
MGWACLSCHPVPCNDHHVYAERWFDLQIVIAVLIWLACGIAASTVGPQRYSARLFFLTTFLLGPLGLAAALIMSAITDAPQPRPVYPGRQRYACLRCGADNDIPSSDEEFECWRCSEHRGVTPRVAPAEFPPASARAQAEAMRKQSGKSTPSAESPPPES